METFPEQFRAALAMVGLGDKRDRAIEAHQEVRDVLEGDEQLKSWGVDTILIGSYGRQTAIYPGRDVDVFAKLPECDEDDPDVVFTAVKGPLVREYGDRVDEQPRSVTISFPDDFSVDVVAATRADGHWKIPALDEDGERTRWEETDPEHLGDLTHERNEHPTVGGQGAYVPIVKLVRQIREHHLGESKPGGLYFELETYWAFESEIEATSFAEILAITLGRIATQLESGVVIKDPALDVEYSPAPDDADLEHAAKTFRDLESKAERALAAEKCPAAVLWREILGKNERGWVFPLPEDCDEQGRPTKRITPISDRGPREARPFA
jgi:hypothetical protein